MGLIELLVGLVLGVMGGNLRKDMLIVVRKAMAELDLEELAVKMENWSVSSLAWVGIR